MALTGVSGRSPEILVKVGLPDRPLTVRKRCPGWPGVLTLKPEKETYAVLPVGSEAGTLMSVTNRHGSGAVGVPGQPPLKADQVAKLPELSTLEDAETRPSAAPT